MFLSTWSQYAYETCFVINALFREFFFLCMLLFVLIFAVVQNAFGAFLCNCLQSIVCFFMLIFAFVQNALSNTSDLIQSSNSALTNTAARFELHNYHIA
jgi:energy-coupling factor transporter transmembrane protein EcfT